jgi:flagellin-like protein
MLLRKELKKYLRRKNNMKFVKNEDAVSPVIGVILMVAITVILAAVIAAFVFNLGGSQEKAPTSSIVVANNPDTPEADLKISHKGGDMLKGGDWKVSVVKVGNAPVYNSSLSITGGGGDFSVGGLILVNTTISVITKGFEANNTILYGGSGLSLNRTEKYDIKLVHIPSSAMLIDTVVEVR